MASLITKKSCVTAVLLLFAACSTPETNETFDAYIEAYNRHDIDALLALTTDDFAVYFPGGQSLKRAGLRGAIEWDDAVRTKVSYQDLEVRGRIITGIFIEQNDFYALLGIDAMRARVTYSLSEDGLIAHQLYEILPGQPSVRRKIAEFLPWAQQEYPDEIAAIFPQGRLIYTRENGERWVALLKKWHMSHPEHDHSSEH